MAGLQVSQSGGGGGGGGFGGQRQVGALEWSRMSTTDRACICDEAMQRSVAFRKEGVSSSDLKPRPFAGAGLFIAITSRRLSCGRPRNWLYVLSVGVSD
jgi:hypothetical protein